MDVIAMWWSVYHPVLLLVLLGRTLAMQGTDRCSAEPCENGGVCMNDGDAFSCSCSLPYTGALCTDLVKSCTHLSGDFIVRTEDDLEMLRHCVIINGNIALAGPGINTSVDLTALSTVQQVTGSLVVEETGLTNSIGLHLLHRVSGVDIVNNPLLTELGGLFDRHLPSCSLMLSVLTIRGNALLSDISALHTVGTITDGVLLDSLAIPDLEGLTCITKTSAVRVMNLPKVATLLGLRNLIWTNSLAIVNNDALLDLEGLHNMQHVPEEVEVQLNNAIVSLQGLRSLVERPRSCVIRDVCTASTAPAGQPVVNEAFLTSLPLAPGTSSETFILSPSTGC